MLGVLFLLKQYLQFRLHWLVMLIDIVITLGFSILFLSFISKKPNSLNVLNLSSVNGSNNLTVFPLEIADQKSCTWMVFRHYGKDQTLYPVYHSWYWRGNPVIRPHLPADRKTRKADERNLYQRTQTPQERFSLVWTIFSVQKRNHFSSGILK